MGKRNIEQVVPEFGTRVLRNNKEFSPHGQTLQMVLQDLKASELFSQGLRRQLDALDAETSDELEPFPQPNLPPRRPPRPVSIVPLSTLLSEPLLPALPPPPKRHRTAPPAKESDRDSQTRRKLQKKASYRNKRNDQRSADQLASGSSLKKHVQKRLASAETTIISSAGLTPRHGSWVGRKSSVKVLSSREVFRLSGLRLIEWDGSVSRILRTPDGHRLMVLNARPKNWESNMSAADERLEWMHEELKLSLAHLIHRRGDFPTVGTGYSFGGGLASIQNVARYVDQGLLQHFPKLHRIFTNLDDKIVNVDNPGIKRAFNNCCYAALHFNLHKAGTVDHYDLLNILVAMCAIYCSGNFDYTRGGHFFARELGVVVQFPAGTSIYVPSAVVSHGNTFIGADEHRSSMAFFVSAGLLRWYHNGYMSDKEFKERASASQLKTWVEYREKLWDVGMDWLHHPSNN